MSTNVYFFFFRLFLKAGAKVENLFLTGKCFLKFFLKKFYFLFSFFSITNLSMSSNVLRGANVTSVFKSHKLFLNYFSKLSSLLIRLLVSISVNVYRCCGCKSNTSIYIYKTFYYKISTFFNSFS